MKMNDLLSRVPIDDEEEEQCGRETRSGKSGGLLLREYYWPCDRLWRLLLESTKILVERLSREDHRAKATINSRDLD